MALIVIPGLADSVKVPGFYGLTQFGQSPIRFGSAPFKVLVIGQRTSAGNLGVDSEVRRILNKDDADTAAGAGSQLARMCYAALDEVQGLSGYELYAAAPTASAGAQATCIATVTGTASANGTIVVYPTNAEAVSVAITNNDTNTAIATKINTAVQGSSLYARMAVTSGVASDAVTFTVKSTGPQGNNHICYVDFSGAPGVSVALSGTGGVAVTSTTTVVGRRYGNGSTLPSYTALLAAIFPMKFHFVAVADNDATSLAAFETQCDAKAAPTQGRMEHYVVASNGNFAAVTSLAQTTLNNQRFTMKWLEIGEQHPSETAAAVAALRAALESTQPNTSYDGYAYRTVKPQRFPADWVTSFEEKQAALDVGVSPLETRADGKVYEVRSITTRCLSGSTPDYRTLDTTESFIPDLMRDRAAALWDDFKTKNPYVRSEPSSSEPEPEAGIAYPSLWNSVLFAEMQQAERDKWITEVTNTPPSTEWNATAKRLMTAMPVVVLSLQHSCGVIVQQVSGT